MQSGEVFTCGDNSPSCCWHKDTNRPLFRPRLVEAMEGIACKQVYTWGKGYCGALGHGDEIDKTTPELLSRVQSQLAVQVCKKTEDLCSDGSYGCGWMGMKKNSKKKITKRRASTELARMLDPSILMSSTTEYFYYPSLA